MENKWYTITEVVKLTGIAKGTLLKRVQDNPEKWGFKRKKKTIEVWKVKGSSIAKWASSK